MEQSSDDTEWDRVLSDPANAATMEAIALDLKTSALSGALGIPEIFSINHDGAES